MKTSKEKKPNLPEGIDFTQDEVRDAVKNKRLLLLILDLIPRCNLNCIYCFNGGGRKFSREISLSDQLSFDEYKKVILDAKELGAKSVIIAGYGEPTLDKNLRDIIKLIHDNKMIPMVFTNGASEQIDEGLIEFFKDHNVTLGVKINSFLSHIQDDLADTEGYTEKRNKLIGIIHNLKYNEQGKLKLWLDTIVIRDNIKEIPSIYVWARENNWWPGVETLLIQGGAKEIYISDPERLPTKEDIKSLFKKLEKIDNLIYGNEMKALPPYPNWYCNLFPVSIKIDYDGTVRKCFSYPPIGNVKEQSLKEIWEGNPWVELYNSVEYVVINGCHYYGCPPRRFLNLCKQQELQRDRRLSNEEIKKLIEDSLKNLNYLLDEKLRWEYNI